MILLIDNDDSFTFNIVELLRRNTSRRIEVVRHNALTEEELARAKAIIFSPGASLPSDYPTMERILSTHDGVTPILGICLGFQAISQHFGAELYNLSTPFHGCRSEVSCDPSSRLFRSVGSTTHVGRYHSWAVREVVSPLRVTALASDGVVMAVEHERLPIFGVQFHVESYMTDKGDEVIKNFLDAITLP